MSTNRILVTGGTGFVASYVIRSALARNFQVRTTVRSPARTPELRRTVGDDSIEVVTAETIWSCRPATARSECCGPPATQEYIGW
ncbi:MULTISPECIES: NmrA family NAD(P)-binding protein [unclassified Micromonospora]|uniref:NmrA family NAD(P)-binding protein n=1 Tax=unclassified Micromonospora TaxID=2617518 RepID=UPI003A846777